MTFKHWFDELTELHFTGMTETERYAASIKINTDHKHIWLNLGKY